MSTSGQTGAASFFRSDIAHGYRASELIRERTPLSSCLSTNPLDNVFTRLSDGAAITEELRMRLPQLNIMVGLWGSLKTVSEIDKKLHAIGADEAVISLSEAMEQIEKICTDTVVSL